MRILFCVSIAITIGFSAANADEPNQLLSPTEAAATMQVPDGFRVTLFAGEPDIKQPIGFCIDDRGRLWVAEAYNYPKRGKNSGDRILIFEDTDGDGRHDKRTVFYDKLNYVAGIEIGFGGVWVMSPPFMYYIPDEDGDDVPDKAPEVLLDGFGDHANAHNMANGFAWGPDGWLYATHGRTNWSLVGKPGTPPEQRMRIDGGVWRYHPTRHVWENYADGTTNPWGIDWNDYGHAFICNCVNPHVFQVIQGAHYEPWRGRKNSRYAFQRIGTIADHLHFVGLSNVRNGLGSVDEDAAGGGHAHCGCMIYLGDQFPKSYRNQLFTNNIHGKRINNDLLRRVGSGYAASHGPDLMRSHDPWFMGVLLQYGPSGEVYVIDWSDTGECHSTRNTQKQTGRIFRISYLQNTLPRVDLSKASDDELVDLQLHDNDWHVRHARRRLQERAASANLDSVAKKLRVAFQDQSAIPKKLRALWALHAIEKTDQNWLSELLQHEDENIRSWAVTLLGQQTNLSDQVLDQLTSLAASDPSSLLRLSLASFLQQRPLSQRWSIAANLVAHGEDSDDQNLPLMNWYAIEPLIEEDLARFIKLASQSQISQVRINIARRAADHSAQGLVGLIQTLQSSNRTAVERDILSGILLGLEGKRIRLPSDWNVAYKRLIESTDRDVVEKTIELAVKGRHQDSIRSLQARMVDQSESVERRRDAMRILAANKIQGVGKVLLGLIDDELLRESAIDALASFNEPVTGKTILASYQKLSLPQKRTAISTLSSRADWSSELLDAIESGVVKPSDLTAYNARQIRSISNQDLTARLNRLWGEVRETPKDRARQITKLRQWLTPDTLAQANHANGKKLFSKHCASCHRFFGEGGKVGPDITGAQRDNLAYMLENILDPSASVSKNFQTHIIENEDGRVITGLVESETKDMVTIRTEQKRISIPVDEIVRRKKTTQSIMPNGLLETLSEREIRDLFGYLQK